MINTRIAPIITDLSGRFGVVNQGPGDTTTVMTATSVSVTPFNVNTHIESLIEPKSKTRIPEYVSSLPPHLQRMMGFF